MLVLRIKDLVCVCRYDQMLVLFMRAQNSGLFCARIDRGSLRTWLAQDHAA